MSLPLKPEHAVSVNTAPMMQQSPSAEYNDISKEDSNARFESHRIKDAKLKRHIRILRFITRILSLVLSAFLLSAMAFSLAKYLLTKDHILPGNVHPWATPTKLWPTIMLLAMALVTFLLNFIVLCSYCCGAQTVKSVSSMTGYIGYAMMAVHVVVWAVTVGLFKMANTGNDLWGWSCSDASDAIQEQVQSFLNFGSLCKVQTGAYYITILETILYFITFITYIIIARRILQKKKLERLSSQQLHRVDQHF